MRSFPARCLVGSHLLIAAMATHGASAARALGPEAPAAILESALTGPGTQDALRGDAYEVRLVSDDVTDLEIRAWVEDASGNVIEERHVGRSILSTMPADRSLHPDIVVARAGDVVSVPRPHQAVLPAGVYAEVLRVAISSDSYFTEVTVGQLRFFRVSTDGRFSRIGSEEFTAVSAGPLDRVRSADGGWIDAYRGTAFPPDSEKGRRVFAPILDSEGNITNLDGRLSPEPAPATGDRSEAGER